MKKILYILGAAFLLMSFGIANGSMGDLVNALRQGDAAQVSKYFDGFVDIKLPNREEVKSVSKNQATVTLKDFYAEQNITGFDLTSQREMGGTGYLVGKLKSEKKNFNVTLMTRIRGNDISIISVRIN